LANSVRGFAEIEVEHPIRVGNHGRAASGQVVRLSRAQPYALETSLSRAEVAEKGAFPESRPRCGRRGQNSPLLWRAQRDVIRSITALPQANHGGGIVRRRRCTEPSISPRTPIRGLLGTRPIPFHLTRWMSATPCCSAPIR